MSIKEVKKLEGYLDLIRDAVDNNDIIIKNDFINQIVKKLNNLLEADYTFIGELNSTHDEINTISISGKNGIIDNFSYKIVGTPCEKVIGNYACSYSDNVDLIFPDDQLLIDMGIKAYVGVPLFNSKSKPVGILVSLFKSELVKKDISELLLTIYASRIGAELEHEKLYLELKKVKEDLQESHEELAAQNEEYQVQNIEYKAQNEDFIITNEELYKKTHELEIRNEILDEHKRVYFELSNHQEDDYEKSLQNLLKTTSKTLNVKRVSFWKCENEFTEIKCELLFNGVSDTFESGVVLEKSNYPKYFKALEKNKTIVANDANTDPNTKEFSEGYLKPLGIKSMLDTFVQVNGKTIGLICLEHLGEIRKWRIEEQQFAVYISNLISLEIESKYKRETELLLEEERKNVYKAQFEGQESEKNRISAELHDGLGQILTAAKLTLGALLFDESINEDAKAKIKDIKNLINESTSETKRISMSLMPRVLEDFGLEKAIEKLLMDVDNNSNISVNLNYDSKLKFDKTTEKIIYRIFQESLNNILKHSNATRINAELVEKNDFFKFIFSDNGKGFDNSIVKKGLGLENIKQRALSIGAELEIKSSKEKGTDIILFKNISE